MKPTMRFSSYFWIPKNICRSPLGGQLNVLLRPSQGERCKRKNVQCPHQIIYGRAFCPLAETCGLAAARAH